jgi:predicted NBD/HSP70 family sugar kinase
MTVFYRGSGDAPSPDRPGRQESLRDHNLTLIYRQIAAAGARPVSRADIATSSGLTRATVSRIVEELVAGRLVAEVAPEQRSGARRPPTGLVLSREGPAGLGLEVRENYLACCIVDLTGTVRHLTIVPGDYAGQAPQEVLAGIAAMADAAIAGAREENMTVVGATLAVPGLVDGRRMIRLAPHLGWRDIDAGQLLADAITTANVPVTVDNEANLAALGEMYASEEHLTHFLYVSGDTTLGAGIVIDGHLMRGARGWSGELGHVSVDPEGAPCHCGARGCLEGYASLETLRRAMDLPASPELVSAIAAQADAGSPAMLAALDRAGVALGTVLAGLVNVFDFDTIILGGGYAVLASWLTDPVQRELDRRVLTAGWAPVEARPSLLGPDAAVIGAALTVVDEVRRYPPGWLAEGDDKRSRARRESAPQLL